MFGNMTWLMAAIAAGVFALAGQPAKTLSPDAFDSPAETSVLDAQHSEAMAKAGGGHAGHGGTYAHVDVGREAQAPAAEPHQHGHTEHSEHSEPAEEEEAAAVYSCPMHPEVTSSGPGTCPKCGMALVERREE